MKKLFLLVVMICFAGVVKAQNIQLHYDLGRAMYNSLEGRPWVTTTVEMFKADKWGSTYFFVDMDYTDKGVSSAYWEISRELKFWKAPVSAHVEYNGGLNYIFWLVRHTTGITLTSHVCLEFRYCISIFRKMQNLITSSLQVHGQCISATKSIHSVVS